ncbi:MAG TPA: HD domain-containing protein [Azospirillaceae bacterium]|nr:HD domain-containing protein [Azospirillaceae bacterium]
MNPVLAFARAFDFVAQKHADQRRKGARAEPYVNHLAEVASLLAEATEGRDPTLVIAGLLHDAIEDTDATREEIEALFGAEVAGVVAEVTDDKRLPKAERKRKQVEHVPYISTRARLLKLADKTSNLRAMVTSPPFDWDLARKAEYFAWAKEVIDAGCRGLNTRLESWFDEAYEAGMARLEQDRR